MVTSLVLLTGATGYVGGRLLRVLERGGRRVRCLARRPEALAGTVAAGTEVVPGDVLDPASLGAAMRGVDAAYYFVHSMGSRSSFEREDRVAAENFGRAAKAGGVRRIVYLGGLGAGESLSAHLKSRQETGDVLRASGVPVTEFRASIVIGSGSLSFEMIRALAERLPVMIAPKWVATEAQPIAIEDLLAYLVAALGRPDGETRVFEIGGEDAASYGDLLREYARQRGLRRLIVPVPILTPRLSSLWLGLVTPLYARVGRKIVESLRNPTIVRDRSALAEFPAIRPMGYRAAIARALVNEDREFAETRWSDALSSGSEPRSWGGARFGSRLVDSRTARVAAPPERAFAPIQRIGGESGWYACDFLWRFRGFVDLLSGGVGLRRGRRHPVRLVPGDPLDFWRVEAIEPPRRLKLAAEMRLPGRAWLEFEVTPDGAGGSVVRQTASFDPRGLFGLVYWYALWPLHQMVFGGMLRALVRRGNAP